MSQISPICPRKLTWNQENLKNRQKDDTRQHKMNVYHLWWLVIDYASEEALSDDKCPENYGLVPEKSEIMIIEFSGTIFHDIVWTEYF